jgi:hypothetical protein
MVLVRRCQSRSYSIDTLTEALLSFPKGDQSYKRIGTAYELYAQSVLQKFGIRTEIRGSAGDGGVDLHGIWCLGGRSGTKSMEELRTLSVIGQCKKMSKPLTPNFIRELEGTFQHCAATQTDKEHVALMVSRTAASKQALERIRVSQVPITFIRLIDALEDDLECSEAVTPSPSTHEHALHFRTAMAHNHGLMHALMNQAMQSKYPEMSVVMKRFRIDNKVVYLPTFVYNGVIISSLLNKG